ncbi:MAG: anti-sigma factor [Candidatus Competibacteraceae bacterium]|jgi:anti-sigma-K factor RskA|nr:anti-sigma factor [Candidatus Competibacteraceae bacterium]
MNPSNTLLDLLAAEYALGTLKGSARQRFVRRLYGHYGLRRRVQRWETMLFNAMGYPQPIPPPPKVWDNLSQQLFPEEPVQHATSLAWWRNLALFNSLLAGLLILLLSVPPPEVMGYVALIGDANKQPLWMVSGSTTGKYLYVTNTTPMAMPADKRCFLWFQSDRGIYALGTLPQAGGETRVTLEQELRSLLPGRLLVTLENNGSHTPTTPGEQLIVHQDQWIPLKTF